MKHYLLAACLLLFVIVISCKRTPAPEEQETQQKTLSLQNIDSTIRPGDNFFLYANGKWFDTATILPTESRAGARLEMDFKTRANIKSILEESARTTSEKGTVDQKIGDFYASGMDTVEIEKRGFEPIQPYLRQLDSINSSEELMQFVAAQWRVYNPLLIGQFVGADDKNSKMNTVFYYQSGLGLPDRDYYFSKDAAIQEVIQAYQTYLFRIFQLIGEDSLSCERKSATVYNIEKQLAAGHRTNVDLRNPQLNYNKMAVADLDQKMKNIRWKELMKNLNIQVDSIVVGQPGYYTKLNELLKTIPIDDWKTYLEFHVIDGTAIALSSDFENAHFDYYGRALNGQKKMKPRWERVYHAIDASLGEDLGQLYVKKYFTADAKRRMQELVDNLQKAFESRITHLDWMTEGTKEKAKDKLSTFIKKVGFPDEWRDYSKVTIDRSDWFGNLTKSGINQYNYESEKIGKPVNRGEWGMTPPTNNAYYNPMGNEIVFPAGILQFPMFDISSDDALNYGGIGMVIGHELTHGFDDQGAQYDRDGNLKNWWTEEDFERFNEKGKQVIALYDGFVVLDSIHVNGALTQGENTADIGGIAIAYDAFKLTSQGKDTVKIDGLTPDQRFFLSFAQTWRKKVTDQALLQQVKTDPHSPGNYRVIGPLMNFTPFYEAFGVKEGDKMFVPQDQRIKIW